MSRPTGHKSNQILALDTPLSYDPDNEMIWGDESSNKELIFLRVDGTSVRRHSLTTRQITKFATSLGELRARIAKFAPESHLLCLMRNEREVEFLDLRPFKVSSEANGESSGAKKGDSSVSAANGVRPVDGNKANSVAGSESSLDAARKRPLRFVQSCVMNAKVENRLLGFFWPSATILVLISKVMIEIFNFNTKVLNSDFSKGAPTQGTNTSASSPTPSPFTKIREVAVPINWWSYSAASRILLISTESTGSKLSPYYFSSSNMELVALPKFKIDLKGVERISKSDIYLRQLYGQIFCIYTNSATNELVFYQLTLDQAILYLTITNLPSGQVKLSFVDNLVLAHSSLKITAVYDIRFRPKQSIVVENPVAPPLPIARPMDIGLPSNTVAHTSDYSGIDNTSPRHIVSPDGVEQASSPQKTPETLSSDISPSKSPGPASISSPVAIQPKTTSGGDPVLSPDVKESGSDALATSSSFINLRSAGTPKCSPHSAISSPNMMSKSTPQYGHPATIDFSRAFVYDYVQFLVPDFAVNRLNGQIYRLAVNYEAFAAAFRDPVKLVSILMRRERSKPILLKIIRKLIEQRYDLRIIADILDRFTAALHTHTEEQKRATLPTNLSSSSASTASPKSPTSSSSPNRASVDGSTQPARTSSPILKRSSFDPWGSRRSDQYVTAFKKSKGGNSSLAESSSSSTSPLNASPLTSPSSSLTNLPSPEELGLDLNAPSEPVIRTRRGQIVISQQDMYTQVFLPLEEKGVHWKTLECVLMSYITSLTQHYQLPVDSDIYGFLIDLLVRNKQYYQLHQLLQLRVIPDTLHVACQLMHLSSTYPPATQLALDMFKRLKEHAYTIESLLTSGMVLIALKFVKSICWTLHEAQRLVPRFLQEARNTGDSTLFYATYTFFAQRNEIFPGLCDDHARYFTATFETPPSDVPAV